MRVYYLYVVHWIYNYRRTKKKKKSQDTNSNILEELIHFCKLVFT